PFGDPEVPLTPHIHEKEAKGVGEIKPFGDPEVPLTPHRHEREVEEGEENIPGEQLPLTPHRKE
ncbi:MAG: hypothetical protein H6Q58_1912, partial [Firmicutes bacterium]|nr:hypothetical protein [Bacillota bacterium]